MRNVAILIPVILASTTLLLTSGCATTGTTQQSESVAHDSPHRPALINHVVFFTLTDRADVDALIEDCNTRLAPIPGVVSYFCGKHVDTGRASVDTSYHVGLYVGFNSFEDYDVYVEHPDHIALVEDWQPRIESLLVRDVYDQTD